eukprot:3642654-Amphidinium_carterae.1
MVKYDYNYLPLLQQYDGYEALLLLSPRIYVYTCNCPEHCCMIASVLVLDSGLTDSHFCCASSSDRIETSTFRYKTNVSSLQPEHQTQHNSHHGARCQQPYPVLERN